MSAGQNYESQAAVAPLLPLALLESIRVHDRPSEVLEDENLAASLPRRLGLTDVIHAQILQYEEAWRRRRRVAVEPVADLLRLVLRRPDAAAIFREAGQNAARRRYARVSPTVRGLLRIMPRPVRRVAMRRAAISMARRIVGSSGVEKLPGVLGLRITGGLIVATDPSGVACLFYQGALEELARLYTGTEIPIVHSPCIRDGAPACEWRASG